MYRAIRIYFQKHRFIMPVAALFCLVFSSLSAEEIIKNPNHFLTEQQYQPSNGFADLEERLIQLEKKLGHLPYERATLAIIRYFTTLHGETVLKRKDEQSFPNIFQPEEQDAVWMSKALPDLVRRLNDLEQGKVEPLKSPRIEADRQKTSYHDGSFFQNGQPIFIVGLQDFWYPSPEVGFAATGWTFSAAWEFPESPDNLRSTVEKHLKAAEKAARYGQFWDELYSVHIRPQWFGTKYPALGVGVGFLGTDITHTVSKQLDKKTFESILPKLSSAPNFLFLDLSNEPAFNGKTECAEKEFQDFLQQQHGSISVLNEGWGTSYNSFGDIQVPAFVNRGWAAHNKQQKPSNVVEQRQYIDWSEFNCRRFNDFFSHLVSMSHEMAPKVWTYTKIVAGYWPWAGVDAIANVRTTDLSGSDAWWVYQSPAQQNTSDDSNNVCANTQQEFAVSWEQSIMHYDMLRSARPDAPIINAEDHQFADTFEPLSEQCPAVPSGHWDMPIPFEHFYSGQWQQAIHGKGLSLLWTHWPRHNIPQRAVATFANSKAALDINRLGKEVHAFRTSVPRIRLLLSRTTELWDFSLQKGYMNNMTDIYRALILNGIQVGFVFEDDLVEGEKPQCEVLFIPKVLQIDKKALATLKESKMNMIALGKESLKNDRYNRPHADAELPSMLYLNDSDFASAPLQTMRGILRNVNVEPEVQITVGGKPSKQAEWCSLHYEGYLLVNICHYGQDEVIIKLENKTGTALDMISMETVDVNNIPFRPQQVRMLKINQRTDE